MEYIFHFSIPLISSVIALAIILFFFYSGAKPKYNYKNAIPVIDVVKSLAKICPLSSSNKWKLIPNDYGTYRCWSQTSFLQKPITLYASSAIVNASTVAIGSLIADMTKWSDWNPYSPTSQLIAKSFSDKQLKRDYYMEAEQIVFILRKANKIESHTSMYRFHAFFENKVGWILFWSAKKCEFMFFLLQPVKNKIELSQSAMTLIIGTETHHHPNSASSVLQRVRNIQDLLTASTLTLVPFQLDSLTESNANKISTFETSISSPSSSQEHFFSLPAVRARKRDARNTMFVLVPYTPSILSWRERKEFKLGVKNMDGGRSDSESQVTGLKQNQPSVSKCNAPPNRPMRRAVSDLSLKPASSTDLIKAQKLYKSEKSHLNLNEKNYTSKKSSDTTSEDSETKSKVVKQLKVEEKNFPGMQLRSVSETALNTSNMSNRLKESPSKEMAEKKLQHIDESAEDHLLAMDNQDQKQIFNSSVSDFEVLESCEFTENRISGFITQGNYGASELQAEVINASQFEQSLNSGDFQLCGGWLFHSQHKGLPVLIKETSNQFLQITSYLCQTRLSISPKDLWKFVKNPQFRFICDETVKRVEVLEKLSSSQKLIHTYHEVGGLLRKEMVDFCLLQTERVELNKYYSCFYSVEFDKCPFMNFVTRGTLRPSGWIVEEAEKDSNESKVTYMIQMISSSDSLLIQELSTLVPQSVHNLKNYIASTPK